MQDYSDSQYDDESNEFLNTGADSYAAIVNSQNCGLTNHFLDQTSFCFNRNVQVNSPIESSVQANQNKWFSIYKLFKYAGPGLLISVAYLDPGNLESDLHVGAIANYKLLWVLMYSAMAGFFIQYLSVKLGSATGFHLAEICYREYGTFMRYFLWIMIEIAIIASDIQQVIGSAVALNLLTNGHLPIWVAILITSCDVFIFLLLDKTGIRLIEAIFASCICLMFVSFLYMYIAAEPDQIEVIKGVAIPWCSNCSSIEANQLIGIIGSVVMPHNIYFHSSLVLSRNFDRRSEVAIKEANKYYAIELACALFVAFIGNLFVTSVAAKSLYGTPQANNITLFDVGSFLNAEYGQVMKIIWAIGLLAAGQCSTITGTYAGQFIMEGFTKINLKRWMRIIITRSISIVPCVIVTMSTYNMLDSLNFWCNIVQSIQIPFALFPILHFTSSKRIMGSFRNNMLLKITCYAISLIVLAVNLFFFINLIIDNKKVWSYVFGTLIVVYLLVVSFFLLGVNNIYRIKLIFRTIFSPHNAAELDELLHANPIYRRPERRPISAQRSPSNYSAINPLLSASQGNIQGKVNPLTYLINKPSGFLTVNTQNLDQNYDAPTSSYNDNLSPII